MSIIRVGLAETKKFAEGYDAIFGKSTKEEKKAQGPKAAKKSPGKGGKKKSKKK